MAWGFVFGDWWNWSWDLWLVGVDCDFLGGVFCRFCWETDLVSKLNAFVWIIHCRSIQLERLLSWQLQIRLQILSWQQLQIRQEIRTIDCEPFFYLQGIVTIHPSKTEAIGNYKNQLFSTFYNKLIDIFLSKLKKLLKLGRWNFWLSLIDKYCLK
jgi:hypothetical protein